MNINLRKLESLNPEMFSAMLDIAYTYVDDRIEVDVLLARISGTDESKAKLRKYLTAREHGLDTTAPPKAVRPEPEAQPASSQADQDAATNYFKTVVLDGLMIEDTQRNADALARW